MTPLVSIIIPLYNAEDYIETCIQSCLNQSYQNIEIIVVDDGSSDSSLKKVKNFEVCNLKIILQENNGASAARNCGLRIASGKFIQFLDSDDFLSHDKIEAQIDCLKFSEDYLCLCNTIHFYDGEDYQHKKPKKEWYNSDFDGAEFLIRLYSASEANPDDAGMVQPNAWLIPRKIIDLAGNWNEELTLDDDGEYFCRVILASQGIKFSPEGYNYYRKFQDQKNLSSQKTLQSLKSLVNSTDLKLQHLKSKSTDEIIDRIIGRHYWHLGIATYPQFRTLSNYCLNKSKELGIKRLKYEGGKYGRLVSRFLGWRVARILSRIVYGV